MLLYFCANHKLDINCSYKWNYVTRSHWQSSDCQNSSLKLNAENLNRKC